MNLFLEKQILTEWLALQSSDLSSLNFTDVLIALQTKIQLPDTGRLNKQKGEILLSQNSWNSGVHFMYWFGSTCTDRKQFGVIFAVENYDGN